jgi:hypothetical protein
MNSRVINGNSFQTQEIPNLNNTFFHMFGSGAAAETSSSAEKLWSERDQVAHSKSSLPPKGS